MLCKNVENKAGSVENLDSGESLFQVTNLRARKIVIENDHLGVLFFEGALDFVYLAFANERCRTEILHSL